MLLARSGSFEAILGTPPVLKEVSGMSRYLVKSALIIVLLGLWDLPGTRATGSDQVRSRSTSQWTWRGSAG